MTPLALPSDLSPDLRAVWSRALLDAIGADPSSRRADLGRLAREVLGPPSPGPASLETFRGHPLAEHLVTSLIVAACVDRAPAEAAAQLRPVRHQAREVMAGLHWVAIAEGAASGAVHRATLQLVRHAPDGRYLLAQVWQREGWWGLVKALGLPFGITPSQPARAEHFRRMASWPEDTTGFAFVRTLREAGIPLPGEPGGLPIYALHHDLMHVLTGYSTKPEGECQLGGFYAGFGYSGWPAWTVVTLLTFELGLRVGPTFTPATRGAFDARAVYSAFRRAAHARFHPLDASWDYDLWWDRPLAEAREALGFVRVDDHTR